MTRKRETPDYKITLDTDGTKTYVFPVSTMRQFVVINNTSRVIKLSLTTDVSDNRYEHVINANKMYISPPHDFIAISVSQTITPPNSVNPLLYVYSRSTLAPGVYSI